MDEANSILLNDVTRGIPVVNLVQVREKKLGKPYSGRRLVTAFLRPQWFKLFFEKNLERFTSE